MIQINPYKFDTLYTMSSGISSKPEQAGHGEPFLSFTNVFKNYFIPESLDELMNTTKEEQQKYSILKGDIFLTRTSEVLDELGMSSVALKDYPCATYSGFLKRLRPKDRQFPYSKYMAFYLRSPLFRKTMTNNAVLTLRASLNENIFSYLNLLLPDIDDQVKIGDFLYLIDEKITSNTLIANKLSLLAKTIYDYWFIQFDFPNSDGHPYRQSGGKLIFDNGVKRDLPVGWRSILVEEVIDKSPSALKIQTKDLQKTGKIPVVDQSTKFICGYTDNSKALISPSSAHIIFGDHTRIVKLVNFEYARGADGTQVLVPKLKELPAHLLYQMIADIDLSNYGYARHFKFLKDSMIILPTEEISKSYEEIASPLYSRIFQTHKENQALSELRDWLVPMFISGQLSL